MVDYLLVKRNSHTFVVVYWGTDLAAIAVDVRNVSFPVHMWQIELRLWGCAWSLLVYF